MAKCKVLQRTHERVCIGGLNHKVEIYVRAIKAPALNSVDFSNEYTLKKSVWAMIETKNGETFFDKSNIEQIVTHWFYIRYIPNVDIVDNIIFRDMRYRILDVENLDSENYFLLIRATNRGNSALPVNEF